MEDLYEMLESKSELLTSKVNEKVESEYKKLKRELAARQEDKQKFTAKLRALDNQIKDLEASSKDAIHYKEEMEKIQEEFDNFKAEADHSRGGSFLTDIIKLIFPSSKALLGLFDY